MVFGIAKMKTFYLIVVIISFFSTVYILAFSSIFEKLEKETDVVAPEGLKIKGRNFTLRRNPFRIRSGAFHYFRVPPDEWSDRLKKLKEMGLNTVDIYIPWNLHEPSPGEFDFESPAIKLVSFLEQLSTYGLYAIVRPGPYICSEWDLGGLPSWLLRDQNMKLRSMYPGYINAVDRYFNKLLPIIKPFQFSYGGPIIAFQIENEYGTYGNDAKYIKHLQNTLEKNHIDELLFVCDNEDGLGKYKIDSNVLQTVNFMSRNAKKMVKKLLELQPNKPVFVTELWDGWFDHWGEKHHRVDIDVTIDTLKYIISESGSFNLYMWHGGTSFGFMNGANANDDGSNYQSDITSYDYNAPVTETGDIGEKYEKLQEFLGKTFPGSVPKEKSSFSQGFTNYGEIELKQYMLLNDILRRVTSVKQKKPTSMEMLEVEGTHAQSYGYIVYQTSLKQRGKTLKIERAKDFVVVVLNDRIVYTSFSFNEDVIKVQLDGYMKRGTDNMLQVVVENCGRVNYGKDLDNQRKGILGSVTIDDNELSGWEIFPLEFKKDWVNKVVGDDSKWKNFDSSKSVDEMNLPSMYKGILYVHHFPSRTFIKLPGWFKGVVFINGFNLGRYWNIGPQRTLYVPRHLLKMKDNEFVLFDMHGITKKVKEYPSAESTHEQDIGEGNSVSFKI